MASSTPDYMNLTWDNGTWAWLNDSMMPGGSLNISCQTTDNLTESICTMDLSNLTHHHNQSQPDLQAKECLIICDDVRDVIIIINMAILCQVVSIFGIFANAINIIVFVKMGFSDAINVTLTGLAVADMGIVIFAVWLCICYNPLFQSLDLPFKPIEVVYLTAGLPRLSLARISSWILAFASFERCLCITLPLTFRSIITPKRSLCFIIGAFVVMAASVAPSYYTSRLVEKYDATRNTTYIGLGFIEDRFDIDNAVFGIGVFLSVTSFLGVIICTIVLVYSLNKKSKWRESTVATITTGHSANAVPATTYRNKKVGQMVSLISTIFIICFIPNTLNQLVMSMVPDYTKGGRYINTNQVFWSIGFLLESINASVNIFMYLKMSSRFRKTLYQLIFGSKAAESDIKTSSVNGNSTDRTK